MTSTVFSRAVRRAARWVALGAWAVAAPVALAQNAGVQAAHSPAPAYPVSALTVPKDATVTAKIDIDEGCATAAVRLTSEQAVVGGASVHLTPASQSDFEGSVRTALKAWRWSCAAGAPLPQALQLEFVFRFNDQLLTEDDLKSGKGNAAAADSQGLRRVAPPFAATLTFVKRQAPNYPPSLLQDEITASITMHVIWDETCTILETLVVAQRFYRSGKPVSPAETTGLTKLFKESIDDALRSWKVAAGTCPRNPFVLEQAFSFKITGSDSFKQSAPLPLASLLKITKDVPQRRTALRLTENCPQRISLHMRQPQSPNVAATLLKGKPELPPEWLVFLAQLELKDELEENFFGHYLVVDLPCVSLDLRPKAVP